MESGVVENYIPWFCILSAVGTIVARTISISKSGSKIKWSLVPLGVAILLASFVLIFKGSVDAKLSSAFIWLAVSIPAGAIFAGLSQLGFSVLGKVVVSSGVVGFLISAGQVYFPEAGISDMLALAAGLGIGASMLALQKPGLAVYDLPIIAILAVIAGSLGKLGEGGLHEQSGTVLLAGAVASGFVGMAVTKAAKGKSMYGLIAAALFFGISVWYFGAHYLIKNEVFYSGIAGTVTALICCWAVSKEGNHKPLQYSLGAFLWLGAATFAFSHQHGYGMSIAALSGLLIMLMLDRRDVMVTLSPIIALAFFRLFTEMFPASTQALDIGQHYGLLGLLVGIAVIIVVMESLETINKVESLKARGAGALTSCIALGIVLAATVFLGPKGSVGLLVGLCLGPAVKSLSTKVSAGSVAFALSLVALFIVAHPTVTQSVEIDHAAKQALVLWTGSIVLVLGLVAAWLTKNGQEETNAAI